MKTTLAAAFTLIGISLLFGSCRRFEQEKIIREHEPFTPSNLYPTERLPAYLTRIAVLPCHYSDQDSALLQYADETFQQELAGQRLFETVVVTPAKMKALFGTSRVYSAEELPENFLPTIAAATGANGVLFVDLHAYRPYRPLALGVRAKLVDLRSADFLWAIDETFDSARAEIQNSANLFQRESQVHNLSGRTGGSVLSSPRAFAKYVAATTFSTLPER